MPHFPEKKFLELIEKFSADSVFSLSYDILLHLRPIPDGYKETIILKISGFFLKDIDLFLEFQAPSETNFRNNV